MLEKSPCCSGTWQYRLIISATVVLLFWFIFLGSSKIQQPPKTFHGAKMLLANIHEQIGHLETLYCGCYYVRKGYGGEIDRNSCGLRTRKNEKRSRRVEWEHIVPASWIGENHSCWTQGHDLCVKNGTRFKGRKCCMKPEVDQEFMVAHNDPHNLFPASGELNRDRLNHPYGTVNGELRKYGLCDFELGGSPKVVEPTNSVRGEIARAMLYMEDKYKVNVRMAREELLEWHKDDPPASWELKRAMQIKVETGLENSYIAP